MDDKIVVVIVGVFWALWWIGAVWFHRSWIPVIPFMPLGLGMLGSCLNWFIEMTGAYVVIAIHVFILLGMVRNVTTIRSHKH